MKKYAPYLFALTMGSLSVALFSCDSESNVEDPDRNYFVKYYGGDGDQYGVDMEVLPDGTFLLLGNWVDDPLTNNAHIYVMRVDAEGEVIWNTHYGLETEQWNARDLELTNDGNFVVVADYKPGLADITDIKLLKFSLDGELLDEGVYGTPAHDYSRTVTALGDGGFIISGTTDSTATFNIAGETDPDPADAFNLRVDANLNRLSKNQWAPVYIGFGDNIDVAVKIFQTGAEFYTFGYTNSTLSGDLNPNERRGLFYFSRTESNFGSIAKVWYPGNVVNVNDTEISYVQSVGAAIGGGYLIVGTSQNNIGVSEIFVARMRSTLTFQNPLQSEASFYSTIPLGPSIRGVSGCPSTAGATGYLILGNEVRTTGATNIWLTKIDQSGQVIWSTTLGSETEEDKGAVVRELPDGKIVVFGTMGLADNQFKMALIKMNGQGQFLK